MVFITPSPNILGCVVFRRGSQCKSSDKLQCSGDCCQRHKQRTQRHILNSIKDTVQQFCNMLILNYLYLNVEKK